MEVQIPARHLLRLIVIGLMVIACPRLRADDIDQLDRDASSWIAKAQALYRLDCDDMGKIWNAYCGVATYGNHEEYDVDFARDTAKELQSPEQSQLQELLDGYEGSGKLRDRAEEFKKNPDTESRASTMLDAMKKEYDKLQSLKDGLVLKGSDHPFVQFAIDYGRRQHDSKNSDLGCDVYDREFPDAGGRPDCVKVSSDGCWVYEFKPNTSRAVDAGKRQLERYVPAVEKYYQEYLDSHGDRDPDSDHGGKDIVKKINDNSKCWEDKKVKFHSDVVTCDMCEKRYTCIE